MAVRHIEELMGWLWDQGLFSEFIPQLLSTRSDTRTPPARYKIDGVWRPLYSTGSFPTLRDFVGYIDLETTGLKQTDRVICAVATGRISGGDIDTWYCAFPVGAESLIDIQDSVIANWNQPYDRQYYRMAGGRDTNTHLDLMGLAGAVRGRPESWAWEQTDWEGNYVPPTWQPYVYPDLKLATVHESLGFGPLDKSDRDKLIAGTLTRDDTVAYCVRDVQATVKVGVAVLREWLAMAPNPISTFGHCLRHSFVLPISDKFEGYWERAESWYQSQLGYQSGVISEELLAALIPRTDQHANLHEQYPDRYNPRYIRGGVDKLMTITAKTKKPTKKNPNPVTVCRGAMGNSGMLLLLPIWVLCQLETLVELFTPKFFWELTREGIKPTSPITALILGMAWMGEPVIYRRLDRTWHAGDQQLINLKSPDKGLSTPLCKDYSGKITSGILTCPNLPKEFQASMANVIRWRMFRGRVADLEVRDGWLTPCYSPTGTLSCRAVDKVFLLIGSPKFDYGGSEMMSMIEAKPGYVIMQYDLDSAELVLGGSIATATVGSPDEEGSDFARANLLGSKEEGTDTHSMIAFQIEMERAKAKNLVYGAQYKQGKAKRRQQIMIDSGCSEEEADRKATAFEEAFIQGLAKPYFDGLKLMTDNRAPTMLLGRAMPLAYQHAGRAGTTSIANHNVQSLQVDWLDCLMGLTYMRTSDWDHQPQCILTRHDEPIFHVRVEDADRFREVLRGVHADVKTALLERFGITKPSPGWLYASSIDVGPRYKKSPDANPSTVTTDFG